MIYDFRESSRLSTVGGKTLLLHSLVIAGMLLGAVGCGREERRTITIKGSDTMVLLGQRWAETYMHHHPGVTVQVTGGGSGTGIAALINGGTDICEASRPMNEKERNEAKKRHGKDVKEIPVALDGVALYVHRSNPLDSLTLEEVEGIYTGRVLNAPAPDPHSPRLLASFTNMPMIRSNIALPAS